MVNDRPRPDLERLYKMRSSPTSGSGSGGGSRSGGGNGCLIALVGLCLLLTVGLSAVLS